MSSTQTDMVKRVTHVYTMHEFMSKLGITDAEKVSHVGVSWKDDPQDGGTIRVRMAPQEDAK